MISCNSSIKKMYHLMHEFDPLCHSRILSLLLRGEVVGVRAGEGGWGWVADDGYQ